MSLEPLFTPYRLRDLNLRNRFTLSPMQKYKPPGFVPHDDMLEYHRIRARNGLGMLVTQGTVLDHSASISPYARLIPASYDAWGRIAEAVQAEGCPIVMQIYHDSGATDPESYGPSGYTAAGIKKGRGLTHSEIEEILDLYVLSARMVKKLGFNGVEIHGGQYNALGMFLSPIANKRDDEYGGSNVAERMRFPIKLISAVRDAVGPDFVMGFKAVQWPENKIYPTPDDLKIFLDAVTKAGIDYFNASTDKYWEPEFEGSHMNLGGWVKKLSGKPVTVSGGFGLDNKLRDVVDGTPANSTVKKGFGDLMARFHNGELDMVALGRTMLTDPDYILKLRDGRFDDIMQQVTIADVAGKEITFSKQVRPKETA